MDQRSYRETLKNVPHMLALWERMTRLSQEFPGYSLVKQSPFLVSDKGKVRKYSDKGFILLPTEETSGLGLLWAELLMIEYMLNHGFLKKKSIRLLEKRSKPLLERINKLSHNAAVKECEALALQGTPLN